MTTTPSPTTHPFYQKLYNNLFEAQLQAGNDPDAAQELAMKEFEKKMKPPNVEDLVFVSRPEWEYIEDE